jgi:hypothetical protein
LSSRGGNLTCFCDRRQSRRYSANALCGQKRSAKRNRGGQYSAGNPGEWLVLIWGHIGGKLSARARNCANAGIRRQSRTCRLADVWRGGGKRSFS